jgi:4-diphosphocytidyl-2-C-methyl-D-erythritol kinase
MHLLDAEMVSLDLHDTLTFSDGDGLEVVGDVDAPAGDDNLVRRALRAVERSAHVVLDKRIPSGAGLGGGSSDAAAVLRWAGVHDLDLATSIGADVAFCVVGGRARVRDIGEWIESLPFENRTYTLLTPPLTCSTPAVYRAWDELGGPTGEHGNDLEPAVLTVAPELARWRDALGDATGQQPRLAGSGSTWFVEGDYPGDGRVVTHTTSR